MSFNGITCIIQQISLGPVRGHCNSFGTQCRTGYNIVYSVQARLFFFIFYGAKARIFFQLWVARLFILFTKTDCDFHPQTCTNGLVFRECKHIKNIFEDVYFTKNLFHITLKNYLLYEKKKNTKKKTAKIYWQ